MKLDKFLIFRFVNNIFIPIFLPIYIVLILFRLIKKRNKKPNIFFSPNPIINNKYWSKALVEIGFK